MKRRVALLLTRLLLRYPLRCVLLYVIFMVPAYRGYYTIRDKTVVLLLCGGDKASQQQDIHRAQHMAREL